MEQTLLWSICDIPGLPHVNYGRGAGHYDKWMVDMHDALNSGQGNALKALSLTSKLQGAHIT